MRGLLATAMTTGALLALPAAASAAITYTVTKDASTPSIEPGAVVKYNVAITNDAAPLVTGGTLEVSGSHDNWDGNPIAVAGGVVTEPGAGITVGADAKSIVIADALAANETATVQFDVTNPDFVISPAAFRVRAQGTVDGTPEFEQSTASEVFKGDGSKTSKLYTVAGETAVSSGVADWWVAKDGTTSTTFTIHNWGDGPAYNVYVKAGFSGGWNYSTWWNPSPIDPPKLKAGSETEFDWEGAKFTPVAGADCVATAAPETCVIGEIPAGGSKTVTVGGSSLVKLGVTVFPTLNIDDNRGHEKNRDYSIPAWNDTDNYTDERSAAGIKITDGKTVQPRVALDGPSVANGRSDVSYPFEIANGGSDAVTNGVLRVVAPSFTDKGADAGNPLKADANNPIDSLKSVTLSSGTTCAAEKEWFFDGAKYVQKERIGIWLCPVASIPAGARVTGTVVANFASGRVDSTTDFGPVYTGDGESGSVAVTLYTGHFNKPGSTVGDQRSTRLNRATTSDLDISVKSAKQIGAERLGLHVVTIKNNGPSTAKNVSLGGSFYKLVGKFETTLLPGSCTGVVVSDNVSCAIGDIASGQSASITIPVLGANKVGLQQVATYWASHAGYDPNDDNDNVAHVQEVVKAALAPLEGVKIGKAPAIFKFATLGKTGLKSTVDVPGASRVVVDLQVSRLVAQKMGLVKAPKGTKARAKASPFIKIGTGVKVMKAAGKATVVTKLTKAYKVKVLKLRKPLKVQRVVTVTSTAALTKGATHVATNNLTLRK